jgi:hypothetical protein
MGRLVLILGLVCGLALTTATTAAAQIKIGARRAAGGRSEDASTPEEAFRRMAEEDRRGMDARAAGIAEGPRLGIPPAA